MSFHGTGTGRIVEAVRERLTYANVMATTAVFIALGGSAWALTANSIGTKHLRDRAVKTDKVADSAITARKLGCRGNSARDEMVATTQTATGSRLLAVTAAARVRSSQLMSERRGA